MSKEQTGWTKTLLSIRSSNFPLLQCQINQILEEQGPEFQVLNRRQRRAAGLGPIPKSDPVHTPRGHPDTANFRTNHLLGS